MPAKAATLFGESQSRIVISATPEHAAAILNSGLPVMKLGVTGGDQLKIGKLAWDVKHLRDAWFNAITRIMDRA